MKLIDALKTENIRVSNGSRWLVLEGDEWLVYYKRFRSMLPELVYKGDDEDRAVTELLKD